MLLDLELSVCVSRKSKNHKTGLLSDSHKRQPDKTGRRTFNGDRWRLLVGTGGGGMYVCTHACIYVRTTHSIDFFLFLSRFPSSSEGVTFSMSLSFAFWLL